MLMMMKKNITKPSTSSSSKSKLGNGRREKQNQIQKSSSSSPRSPFKVKDLNISTSYSSSSTATSVSSEAPRGCSRFLLSNNHHSSSSYTAKNACFRQKSVVSKTYQSAPTVKNLRGKLSDGGVTVKKGEILQNTGKPNLRGVHKLRKKPPPSSRSGVSIVLSSGLSSKPGLSNDFSSGFELGLCDNGVNFTPVNKLGTGSDLNGLIGKDRGIESEEKGTNCSDSNSHTPPVQISVSPEIQCGSTSVVAATPTPCYAAGHVVSGVTDRRKCRPKGLLTVGNKVLFGSSKAKLSDCGDDNVTGNVNHRRDSLVPSPIKASIHWISSPVSGQSGEAQGDHDGSGMKLNSGHLLMPLDLLGCSSSPFSSLGFSSEVFNKSNSTITTSDATTASGHSGGRGSSLMEVESNSEFRSLFSPSFDHMICSSLPTSPTSLPGCKNQHRYDHAGEATPCFEDSVGSENVIRTPQSNSRSPQFGLPHLSRDEISELWFEYEPDSMAELLQRVSLSPEQQEPIVGSPKTSFEFSPLIIPASSAGFTLSQKAVDNHSPPGDLESILRSFPEPEVRISWTEEISSRVFEMDDLDCCCRCLSEDEGDDDDHFTCAESRSVSKSSPLDSDTNSVKQKR